MPEGRMLKKQISISQTLPRLKSDSARLLYTWLIPHLDIEGRFSADPDVVKGHVVPRLKMTKKKVWEYLQDMAENNLIILYQANNDLYLQFSVFEEHQSLRKDREAESKIPAPEQGSIITPGVIQENATTSKDKISKVKLSKEKVTLFEEAFKEFWEAYPKKVAKDYAKEKFMILVRKGELENVRKAHNGYMDYLKARKIHDNFEQEPMNPATFLMKNRWKDYIDYKYKPKL